MTVHPHGHRDHREALAAGRFLRVVNYHNTPASGRDELRRELAAYQRDFDGLTLDDLDDAFAGRGRDGGRPGFLPVFYEGYANSASVAAQVCEELGLVGWFGVCTAFVACPPVEQEAFARSHWIELAREELDGRRLALTWDEVAELAQRHVVFPHTATHAGVADVVTDDDVEREVFAPKRELDARTGRDSAGFAWLWGTPWGGSPRHDEAVRAAGHRYVLSNTMVQRIAR